jgi:hypothetical protein
VITFRGRGADLPPSLAAACGSINFARLKKKRAKAAVGAKTSVKKQVARTA